MHMYVTTNTIDWSRMDQREEYWGNPRFHDPDGYNSPRHYEIIDHTHHRMSHPPPYPQQHHHLLSSPRDHRTVGQPQQQQLPPPPRQQQHHPQYDSHHEHHSHHDQEHRQTTISKVDVLCGRGKTSFNHEGNKVFRQAVSAALDDFINAVNRFEKAIVVQRVVDSVHARGGRFLKEDTREGTWYRLSDQQSKEKVGHAIRDAANLYEVRKKKERHMQQLEHDQTDTTPQLKRTRSDEDEKGTSAWWLSQSYGPNDEHSASQSHRSSYTPTEYSVHDYSVSSANKRRTSMESSVHTTMDYQPQRKRRRTASPSPSRQTSPLRHRNKQQDESSYFHSTMALSDHIVSTPSPPRRSQQRTLKNDPYFATSTDEESPIIDPVPVVITNVVSSGGSLRSDSGGDLSNTVMRTKVSTKLKPSPISSNTESSQQTPLPKQKSDYYHRFTVFDPKQSTKVSTSNPLHFAPDNDDDNMYRKTDKNPNPTVQEIHRQPSRSIGPSYHYGLPSSYSNDDDDPHRYASQPPFPYHSGLPTVPPPGYFVPPGMPPPYPQYPQHQHYASLRYGPPPAMAPTAPSYFTQPQNYQRGGISSSTPYGYGTVAGTGRTGGTGDWTDTTATATSVGSKTERNVTETTKQASNAAVPDPDEAI